MKQPEVKTRLGNPIFGRVAHKCKTPALEFQLFRLEEKALEASLTSKCGCPPSLLRARQEIRYATLALETSALGIFPVKKIGFFRDILDLKAS